MNHVVGKSGGPVSPRPSTPSPVARVEPGMSPVLRAAVHDFLNPHPDLGSAPVSLPVHVRLEAEAVARGFDAYCAPVTADRLRSWLLPICAAVKNPPSETEIPLRCAAVYAVVSDLPAAVFTPASQRAAMARFAFWPSASEVNDLLRADAAPMLAKRDALRRMLAADAAPEPRKPPTQEEIDAVAAKLATLRAKPARHVVVTPASHTRSAADDRALMASLQARAAAGDKIAVDRLAQMTAAGPGSAA